ncbi:MAG: hydrogenase maturation protease, partial [Giesbergeria sp.]
MKNPPLLLLAVGNPSRDDDALGPCLLERLTAAGVESAGDVELLTIFQLQVEHALDLQGRHAILFVDVARPGVVDGVCLAPIQADAGTPPNSHALSAAALLQVGQQLNGHAPPAWQ